MTWRQLGNADYVILFSRYFLLAFLTVTGLGSGTGNDGKIDIHSWPSLVSVLAGVGAGLVNGLSGVQTLARIPPTVLPPGPPPPAAVGP